MREVCRHFHGCVSGNPDKHSHSLDSGVFAGVFGLVALTISYFSLVTEGYARFQGFERTTASLLSLVLYLVPLGALPWLLSVLREIAERSNCCFLSRPPRDSFWQHHSGHVGFRVIARLAP